MHNLGRRVAHDPRDTHHLHPLAAARPATPAHSYRYWYRQFAKDQTGDTCVANACTHFLGDSPFTHRLILLDAEHPTYTSPQSGETGFRGWLYDTAQRIDEFSDTPPAGGTSVRAGFKALQTAGKISAYQWLSTSNGPASLNAVTTCVLDQRPVVIGVNWYQSMFPDPGGWLTIPPGTTLAGGHSVVIDGANQADQKVRILSWGQTYWMRFTILERLLSENGEAATAIEIA